jgi:ectoine hydroxylase-related dioxygenase (phytanoyl-CoA dioxygenase family)
MPLTADQVEALDRDGYIVVADALDAAWVARLARAFEQAPAQADGTQHVRLSDATPEHEAWRALERHPLVTAAAGHILAGAPFRVEDLHGRNPLPGYGQQGLHADWLTTVPGSYLAVTALWMIDPFREDNGATRVVPGSHHITRPLPKQLAQPLARHPHERVVTGPAGGVLILNGHLWHSGRRNESTTPRRAGQMVIRAHTSQPSSGAEG